MCQGGKGQSEIDPLSASQITEDLSQLLEGFLYIYYKGINIDHYLIKEKDTCVHMIWTQVSKKNIELIYLTFMSKLTFTIEY